MQLALGARARYQNIHKGMATQQREAPALIVTLDNLCFSHALAAGSLSRVQSMSFYIPTPPRLSMYMSQFHTDIVYY